MVAGASGTITYRSAVVMGAGHTVILAASPGAPGPAQIYIAGDRRTPTAVTTDQTTKIIAAINAPGTAVLFTTAVPGAGRGGGRGQTPASETPGGQTPAAGEGGQPPQGRGQTPATFGVLSVADGKVTMIHRQCPVLLRRWRNVRVRRPQRGRRTASWPRRRRSRRPPPWSERDPSASTRRRRRRRHAGRVSDDGARRLGNRRRQPRRHGETRAHARHPARRPAAVPRPTIATPGRHRRSRGTAARSSTTCAPARARASSTTTRSARSRRSMPGSCSPDGTKVLIVAERDGDTVSPERGVYLDRSHAQGHARRAARARRGEPRRRGGAARQGQAPLRADRRRGRRRWSPRPRSPRIYGYEKALFDFDSKHITPAGQQARRRRICSTPTSRSATRPRYQWFERANALGGRTANVLATLKGTVNPELVYVVSSHYDSVAVGSGRRRRLVGHGGAARGGAGPGDSVRSRRRSSSRRSPARRPGLLGSREFVRRAVADKLPDRRRAQQRHGRLGQRSAARQHDPLLEPRHPRHPARARRCSSPT